MISSLTAKHQKKNSKDNSAKMNVIRRQFDNRCYRMESMILRQSIEIENKAENKDTASGVKLSRHDHDRMRM